MSGVLKLRIGKLLSGCTRKWQTASLSYKHTKLHYKKNKFAVVTVIVTVLTCGTLICVEISALNRKLSTATNVFEVDRNLGQYISLFDTDFSTEEFRKKWKASLDLEKIAKEPWFSWLQSRSTDPWRLLNLARSDDQYVRHLGVQALADRDDWEDFQYRNIAQAADCRTLVGLARSPDIDLRFFLPPPKQYKPQMNMYDELTTLLTSLPDTGVNKCVKYFTQVALKHGKPPDDKGGFWSFGGQTLASPDGSNSLTEKTVELCSLQALVSHSTVPSHCIEIVERGGLALLQRILEDKADCIKTHILLARILSNIALVQDLHQHVFISGWVTILAKWLKSENWILATVAAKALYNLDQDYTSSQLEEGVYVFHPLHRTRSVLNADIVFVHGVLGGSFRSWRQRDIPDNQIIPGENRTSCWPKDWLAKDMKRVRIVSLDYDTHLSEWYSTCPHDIEKRSLVKRAEEMIEKLRKAGVGDRPIIWAGHSLGGLLIKQMLSLAIDDDKYSCIKDQTQGIIFYGVPHYGSPLANISNQKAAYILLPSIEVQDLKPHSQNLEFLQSRFIDFMKSRSIPCLAFGETKKTYVKKLFSMLQVVPLESSNPGYGEFYPVDADHIGVCKPDNTDCDVYILTLQFIRRCLLQAKVENYLKDSLKRTGPKPL
ncbi:protein SERAC1 [Patella vulgata]|uniref:protein SERAC1 n=1 Tax=Patella vulgata TaxID=6465 RepID=UPI00217F584A|nr:protein SERAC1 [Patella vulgata]XP_050397523.1 protein SERAC1 [Patella vulgata]XP_050397524.1 protein SERAC1 [Patella vulgata]